MKYFQSNFLILQMLNNASNHSSTWEQILVVWDTAKFCIYRKGKRKVSERCTFRGKKLKLEYRSHDRSKLQTVGSFIFGLDKSDMLLLNHGGVSSSSSSSWLSQVTGVRCSCRYNCYRPPGWSPTLCLLSATAAAAAALKERRWRRLVTRWQMVIQQLPN